MFLRRAVRRQAALIFLLLGAVSLFGHDVPDEARIQAFIKPEANRLRIFVRVPLDSMIDILFPTREATPFLDLERTDRNAADGARTWVADLLQIYENGKLLATPRIVAIRLSRKSDPATASYYPNYNAAEAAATGPKLAGNPLLVQGRVAVDVLLETPIGSERSEFRLHPRFGRLGVRVFTTLAFLPPDGGARKFEYEGDPEDFWLNPSIGESAWRFALSGGGAAFHWFDLWLFALCAIVVMRQAPQSRPLSDVNPDNRSVAVAAQNERFRAATARERYAGRHTRIFAAIFLIAQLFVLTGIALTANPPLGAVAGVLVAAAVVYMGIESIVGGTGPLSLLVSGTGCGAVFGIGAGLLLHPSLQFGGAHSLVSTVSFSVGITAGEVILTLVLSVTVGVLLRHVSQPRVGAIILAALAIHISWLNLIERAHLLSHLRP